MTTAPVKSMPTLIGYADLIDFVKVIVDAIADSKQSESNFLFVDLCIDASAEHGDAVPGYRLVSTHGSLKRQVSICIVPGKICSEYQFTFTNTEGLIDIVESIIVYENTTQTYEKAVDHIDSVANYLYKGELPSALRARQVMKDEILSFEIIPDK